MTIPIQSTKQQFSIISGGQQLSATLNITVVDNNNIQIYYNTTLLNNTLYSISGNQITFTPELYGPAIVTILSVEPDSRTLDVNTASMWVAEVINNQLDRLTLVSQQIDNKIAVTLRPEETIGTTLPPLETRRSKAVVFDQFGQMDVTAVNPGNIDYYVALAKEYSEDSEAFAVESQGSASKAQQWSEKDTEVEPGKYSAKYWAEQSSLIAIPNNSVPYNKLQSSYVYAYFNSVLLVSSASNKFLHLLTLGAYGGVLITDNGDGVQIFDSGLYKISFSWSKYFVPESLGGWDFNVLINGTRENLGSFNPYANSRNPNYIQRIIYLPNQAIVEPEYVKTIDPADNLTFTDLSFNIEKVITL